MTGPEGVDDDNRAAAAARSWSAELIERGHRAGEVPIFGSRVWASLPDADPRRVGSVVRAAECWRREGEPGSVAARLKAELAADDALAAHRLRAMSLDLSAAADWSPVAGVSAVELRRRREYGPLPTSHPLVAGRRPWSTAELGGHTPRAPRRCHVCGSSVPAGATFCPPCFDGWRAS